MNFELGQYAELQRRISEQDVASYIDIGGHEPPAGEVPGPLISALFSYLLGVELPGVGTNYLKQATIFHRIARVGEPLLARVEISRLRPHKQLVDLKTTCHDGHGSLVCDGRALVYVDEIRA